MTAPTSYPAQPEKPSTPSDKQLPAYDSGRPSPEPHDAFHALVSDINRILGPSNGIDSAGVHVQDLKDVMLSYQSSEPEWTRYAFADYSRGYTRNLVDAGNGKSNLLLLVWTPGKSSPIHDHANAHCVMKILKGQLRETLYAWPCQDGTACATTAADGECPGTEHTCSISKNGPLQPHALQVQRATTYETDQVTYMSDKLGLHRIGNPSGSEVAVSLHLYTPPNAAKHGCHIFEESTGKSSHVDQCHFYSELGVQL